MMVTHFGNFLVSISTWKDIATTGSRMFEASDIIARVGGWRENNEWNKTNLLLLCGSKHNWVPEYFVTVSCLLSLLALVYWRASVHGCKLHMLCFFFFWYYYFVGSYGYPLKKKLQQCRVDPNKLEQFCPVAQCPKTKCLRNQPRHVRTRSSPVQAVICMCAWR